MELSLKDRERIADRVDRGEMSVDEGNVEMVRAQRVYLVTRRIPAQVRRALNAAVKRGDLGHVKRDGRKPEAYYHPNFEYMVPGERNEYERRLLRVFGKIL